MASLRSMILDGRLVRMDGPHRATWMEREGLLSVDTRERLLRRDTILINATGVWKDLYGHWAADTEGGWRDLTEFWRIPCPKPCYRNQWIESSEHLGRGRVGAMVVRMEVADVPGGLEHFLQDFRRVHPDEKMREQVCVQVVEDSPITFVYCTVWYEVQGHGCCVGQIVYWLNAEGSFQYSFRQLMADVSGWEHQEFWKARMKAYEGWLLHTFARLNCHNVQLVPAGGQAKIKPGNQHAPFSVWHEIVVTQTPVARSGGAGETDEKHEVRFHKVRGHYADYTKGKGLFGKWKVRIWVEEHAAGKEELGTVVSTYKVE
jgi:hypothetical protein